ncbi:hypothetical protein LCGC14_1164690 [marine sediment metagenome]|uniref:Uncharacterized protein n=1 Tax=marine sediment metagenome TaxID=412755 RepID=A0A0F9LRQ7_9ZZZZ
MNETQFLEEILKKLRPRNEFEDFVDINKGRRIMTARYIFNGADLREVINLTKKRICKMIDELSLEDSLTDSFWEFKRLLKKKVRETGESRT